MSSVVFAVLMVTCLFTSIISGIIGMAGGATLLGVMIALKMDPLVANPVQGVVQSVANVSRIAFHLRHVRWRPFLFMALPAVPSLAVGVFILSHANADVICLLMGAAILYAAWTPKWGVQSLSERTAFIIAGVVGGALCVVVGAVGPLVAPFFVNTDLPPRQIVATKAVCQLYLHLLKIVAFVAWIGFPIGEHLRVIIPMGIVAIIGTWIGGIILERISAKTFQRVYRFVLTALALHIIAMAVWALASPSGGAVVSPT